MLIKSFQSLLEKLKSMEKKRSVAVVAAQESHTLGAVIMAYEDGLVNPLLIGDEPEIREVLKSLGKGHLDLEIINIKDPVDCAREAVRMVHAGKADCVMKGKLETGTIMKVLLDKESNLRTGQTMSLLAFMEVTTYHKVFAISDVGLLLYPTLEQKKAIIENAVPVFHALGIDKPKVAVMAAVETVNPKMKETMEAAQLKAWNEEGVIGGCVIEGPISYDLAVSKEAAAAKGFPSPVAGDADLMVVPDITSGNLLAKALTYSGGRTGGFVVGAKVPLIITSRAAATDDKYMAIALAASVGRQGSA